MPQIALFGTLAVYLLLAVLLLSLNILSLWRWWVKAGAIIATCLVVVAAYFTITAMIGWPTFTALPKRFNLVASRIVEPNRQTGADGHIYLWVEELNENNVPVTAPRGYEVPYTSKLADDTAQAQGKINQGQSIMGQAAPADQPADANAKKSVQQPPGSPASQNSQQNGQGALTSGETAAADTIGQGAQVSFSDMPAVTLPDKAAIIVPDLNNPNGNGQ
ncbi:MAG TPA: hypothetical protein VHB74_03270 [Devosia sp.]|nr:hypothetical protein [Devosia sp.]